MRGYVFTRGYVTYEEVKEELGHYTDFKEAFEKLVELNHELIPIYQENDRFFEEGYSEYEWPEEDEEMEKAEEIGCETYDWTYFNEVLEKHVLTDEIEINKQYCVNCDAPEGMYAIKEVEIKE